MYKDITGIILAGGKSKRMGQNKSLLKLGEKTVIERVAELMKGLFAKVALSANEKSCYEFLCLEIIEDIYKDIGPLGGIHSALMNSHTENNFVISCDIPLMTKEMIEFIVNYLTDKLITVAKADGFVQQLCGVYSKKCLPKIEKILIDNLNSIGSSEGEKCKCKVLQLVKETPAEIIDVEKEFPNYKAGVFLNMNNPNDYQKVMSDIV